MQYQWKFEDGEDKLREEFIAVLPKLSSESLHQLQQLANTYIAQNPVHFEASFVCCILGYLGTDLSKAKAVEDRFCDRCGYELRQKIAETMFKMNKLHAQLMGRHKFFQSLNCECGLTDGMLAFLYRIEGNYHKSVEYIRRAQKYSSTSIHVDIPYSMNEVSRRHAQKFQQIAAISKLPSMRKGCYRSYPLINSGWNYRGVDLSFIDDTSDDCKIPALRFTAPFSLDSNHLDGIGFLNHIGGATTFLACAMTQGQVPLNGAKLVCRIRPVNLQMNGYKFAPIVQTSIDEFEAIHKVSGYCLTGQAVEEQTLENGVWQEITFKLTDNPEDWTACLGNKEVNGDDWVYIEESLETTLIQKTNTDNIVLGFVGGEWPNIVEGQIDVHYVDLILKTAPLLKP